MTPSPACLAPTFFLDADHPAVAAFARRAAGTGPAHEQAIRVYYAVRDEILYDPYAIELSPEHLRASAVLARGKAFCIPKAVLLAAGLRSLGIPARLGFADVKNHLATERLLRAMGTDLFAYHGFTELWLGERWVKATPAFNLTLCQKFRVKPLDFDGATDSVLHPFDADGRRHMEYVRQRGSFDDLPFAQIRAEFLALYPGIFAAAERPEGDFAAEAEREHGYPSEVKAAI
ncbi:MAG: transglutaminase domain-containing protein [Alphaproteobacteria bacterium]|nr:transglutaminase domain-containing protein [Alphaproteobacteria bacterium]